MKITAVHTQHDLPSGGLEMTAANALAWDFVRLLPTAVQDREVTLPPANECVGLRVAFRNSGTEGYGYLNPAESETLNGTTETITLASGEHVELQAVQTGVSTWGWESL